MTRLDPAADTPLATGKLPASLLSHLISTYVPTDPALLVGPGVGRDAAAVRFGDQVLVAKTDPITFATKGAADYLVDVNANDLACLGATPRWLLATALFREGITPAEVEAQFAELAGACRSRGISLVGGHSEVMPGLDRTILIGMLLGEAGPDGLLEPGGARVGDRLLLTKGIAVEGTALLARELAGQLGPRIGADLLGSARELLTSPGISVLPEARAALKTHAVHALHDPTEGGLAMAVREIAAAADLGVVVDRERVPTLPETDAIAATLGLDPLGMLASGSLLMAVPASGVADVMSACRSVGVDIAEIGEITEQGFCLREHGRERELPTFQTDEVSRALTEATGNKGSGSNR